MTRNQLEGKQFCAKCEYYYSEFYMCPICYGEQQAEQRIIKILEELDRHGSTHSEFCAARHAYAAKAIARIKGENK